MTTHHSTTLRLSRLSGALYLAIILCGVAGEGLLRAPLIDESDALTTARNLVAHEALFRMSLLSDVVMVLSDVGVGATLYLLFAHVSPGLSLVALMFRLVQAAILGMNLQHLDAALTLAGVAVNQDQAGAVLSELHAHALGYDLGLFCFAVNCVVMSRLLSSGVFFQRFLSPLLLLSGLVYFVGSSLRLLLPHWSSAFEIAYLLPLVAESAFCLALLRGPRSDSTGAPAPQSAKGLVEH